MLWLSLHELRLEPAAERIAYLYPRAVRNANSESNANSDIYAYDHANTHIDSDAHTYTYAQIDADSKVEPRTKVAPHSGAATVITD